MVNYDLRLTILKRAKYRLLSRTNTTIQLAHPCADLACVQFELLLHDEETVANRKSR